MPRSPDTWSSENHDAKIPPRVRLRVFDRAGGCCEICGRKLGPADKWQADHIIALINGGAHSEANLRVACDWCHKGKTREDVAEKSKTARVRAKHLGIHHSSQWPTQRLGRGNNQKSATRKTEKWGLL